MRQLRIPRPSHGTVVAYLALTVAMSGTAAAATGGLFVLGQRNTESRASTVINSNGPALRLDSPAGSPPLAVNRQAKVTNLNADKLDGHSSSAFLRVDGTARSAVNAVNAASAAKAADSDTLDGHDSSYFQRDVKPVVVVQWATADYVKVLCPAGSAAVGGGYNLAFNADAPSRDWVERSIPYVELSDPIGWEIKLQTPGGVDGTQTVYAVCVS